jgi:predicted dehydrogenase
MSDSLFVEVSGFRIATFLSVFAVRSSVAKLKVAIVGAGFIVQRKHISGFQRLKNQVDLVAICDVNLEQAKQVAEKVGIPHAYGDMEQMLDAEKPDLIDICTPPKTHLPLAMIGIRHGCHILTEKPMALTVEDCQQVIDAAKQVGVQICVGHNQLFYPSLVEARTMLEAGEIGEFRGMHIHMSTPINFMTSVKDHWAHKLPGGLIGETGPHMVYLALSFINPIVAVDVNAMKLMPEYPWSRYEDYRVVMRGEHAFCSATLTYATNHWADTIQLVGTDGTLEVDLIGLSLLKYQRPELKAVADGVQTLAHSAKLLRHVAVTGTKYVFGSHQPTHALYIQSFVDALRKKQPSPVPGEMGRDTIKVLKMLTDKVEALSPEQHPAVSLS